MKNYRNHRSYWAFVGLRVSGIALTIFLPFHFLMLGLALEGPNTMDRYLAMTDVLLVKVAEWVLVMLFALHLLFGLRLLALELLPWPHPRDARKPWVTFGGGVAVAVGIIFLFRAF